MTDPRTILRTCVPRVTDAPAPASSLSLEATLTLPPDHAVAKTEDRGGSLLRNVHAFLLFWGSDWQTASTPAPTVEVVTRTARELVEGPAMDGLHQYRAIGRGQLVTTRVDRADPPALFTNAVIEAYVQSRFDADADLKAAITGSSDTFVCVLLPPATSSSDHSDDAGYHWAYQIVGGPEIAIAWAANDGTLRSGNSITKVFFHELVEACSDSTLSGNGIVVDWVDSTDTTNAEEIGDTCNSRHGLYRGIAVQTYWSKADNACVLPIDDLHDRVLVRQYYVGSFRGSGWDDLLSYYPASDEWSTMGQSRKTVAPSAFDWSDVGNTAAFGHAINDGRPFWTGDFTGDGRDDVLFYYPGDDNWWLGSISGAASTLSWTLVANTAAFGHAINDGRPFWTGDFTGDGRDDVLFYYPGDDNWWLGSISGAASTLSWTLVANTAAFGHAINDGRPFWTGDFTGDGRDDVLFYYPGDDNWWLGSISGAASTLSWTLVANTAAFGHAINDGRPFWTGDFTGDGRDDVLFYYPGDDNWWLGSISGAASTLSWTLVANTAAFGHAINDGRPFWTGDFTGDGRDDVLFYYPGDDNWWLGSISGAASTLSWTLVANTAAFGHAINDGRPFWTGDFTGAGKQSVLFYYAADQNWWLGTTNSASSTIDWTRVATHEGDT